VNSPAADFSRPRFGCRPVVSCVAGCHALG
jgi:hypothetical protein